MNKKIYLSLALSTLSLLSLAVFPALADEVNVNTTTTIPLVSVVAEINAEAQIHTRSEGSTNDLDRVNNLETLKKKGTVQIKIRLDALVKLSRRVISSKLTAEQKTQLQTEIDTNKNALAALGQKIASSTATSTTEVAATRALVKSIYTDYRIFAVFIPRINGLMQTWLSLSNIEKTNLSLTATQIKIDALKAKGVDTAKMEKLMVEIKTSLGTAKTKLEAAATTLITIKPADYPGSNETFRRVRMMIREAQKQILKTRQATHRLNALIRLGNKAEQRRLKLLERKDDDEEDREERKDKRKALNEKIKDLRETFREEVKKLKATSTDR